MTPQFKAARDEKAEAVADSIDWKNLGDGAIRYKPMSISMWRLGADWAYAQGQAETTLLEQELIARKMEIERLKHANRAAEYERDEWRRQAEKLLILAKHARGYPQDVLAAPKVVAEQLLAEYAAWKVEG